MYGEQSTRELIYIAEDDAIEIFSLTSSLVWATLVRLNAYRGQEGPLLHPKLLPTHLHLPSRILSVCPTVCGTVCLCVVLFVCVWFLSVEEVFFVFPRDLPAASGTASTGVYEANIINQRS